MAKKVKVPQVEEKKVPEPAAQETCSCGSTDVKVTTVCKTCGRTTTKE
jgi:hypothetical protein